MDSTSADPKTETAAEAPTEAIEPMADPVPNPEPELSAEAASGPEEEPVAASRPEPVSMPEVVAAAPALSVNAGVGATLRAAREGMGKSLPECAKLLRIRQPFLEALEEGRHRDLPGGTYAAGFLRSYAEYLGLDSEEMIRRFRDEGAGGFKNRTELTFPSPVSEGRIPGGAIIFLGLILAAVAYGGWYMLSSSDTKVAEMVPQLPDRLAGVLNRQASLPGDAKPQPETVKPGEEQGKAKEEIVPPSEGEDEKAAASQPPSQPASLAPEPVKTEPPKEEPVKVEPPKVEPVKVEPPKVEPVKVEPPKSESGAALTEGKVYGTEYADARVVLRATGDDCWIQVREMDGSLLMSRLLRRGDSFRVPNRSGLNLMVGNAGSLEVSVDGRKAPPLGASGQVRRDIRLDPDKLATGG